SMRGAVELGLHPSYHSSTEPTIAAEDRQRLMAVTGEAPRLNRQHFLRWRLPDTLRALLDAGFTEDHSLGFTDRLGFRAGTCTPFPYYDLERDEETALMLWPFACMDSALYDRMGIDASTASDHIQPIIDEVSYVQGTFISTWHDRFLSDSGEWKGWWQVMQQTVAQAGQAALGCPAGAGREPDVVCTFGGVGPCGARLGGLDR
ncbi:MAG: polysaccharide deacetylase family protein, partial [Flavobacteriales bacterium]|nr:polysaccharide deacetylase family protein [Flavobacteriales bacterium]